MSRKKRIVVASSSREHWGRICNFTKPLGLFVFMFYSTDLGLAGNVAEYSPDLIFMDIVFTEISGYKVCRTIKDDPRFEKTKVVLCVEHGAHNDMEWATQQGADRVLMKPLQEKDVLRVTKELLML